MEQRLTMITLGVADLARTTEFYERVVGWKKSPGPPGIAFFDLEGLVFSLYPHGDLAEDIGIAGASGSYKGFTLAHCARSETEVDDIFARLKRDGAVIVKPPQRASWGGYSGYFSDPDGHNWEVAYNPYWTIRKDGRVAMEKPAQA